MDIESQLKALLPQVEPLMHGVKIAFEYQQGQIAFRLQHPEGGVLRVRCERPGIIASMSADKAAKYFLDILAIKEWPLKT